jgi:hypothetical protein
VANAFALWFGVPLNHPRGGPGRLRDPRLPDLCLRVVRHGGSPSSNGIPGIGDCVSGGAFPRINQLKSAPNMHWLLCGLHPPFVHFVVGFGSPAQCRAEDSIAHRRGGWVALRPRGPRSGPSYAVSDRHHLIDPIRPTREHIAISSHSDLYAMPSLCGSAEATRGWFRAFAVHSVLACHPL